MAVSLYHAGSKIQIEKEKLSAASDTPRTHPSRENASRAWKKRKPIWIVGKPAALIRASTAPPNGKSPPCLPKKNRSCTLCNLIYNQLGEPGVRRVLGVLALAKKFGTAAVDEACAAALEMGVHEYRFV